MTTPAFNQPQPAGPPPPAARPTRALAWGAFGVAGVLSLGLVGGGAIFALNRVDAGGPQPETALPSSAIAFAKIDLDPSVGQKIDALRFLRKFPAAQDALSGIDEKDDLRQRVFQTLQEEGEFEGVDYARDVEPWLGQRVGMAVLPGVEGGEPQVVVALASTDEEAARRGLSRVTDGGYCSVQPDFAVCGQRQAVVDKAVNDTAKGALADDTNFTRDLADLGEDGIATAWVDGAKVADWDPGQEGATSGSVQGRYAVALRFDGPTLELAGRASDLPPGSAPVGQGTSVGDLPATTLAAFAVTGLDESIRRAWPQIDQSARDTLGQDWQQGLDAFTAETGMSVPDDVAAALGSDTAVAVGPNAQEPEVALVTNGDRSLIDTVVGSVNESSGSSGSPLLIVKDAGERTVVTTHAGYGDEIANGSGLGATSTFKDAVPGADQASAVGYVDIAKTLETFGEDVDDEEMANLAPLSALGLAVRGEEDHAEFTLRLTTR